MKFRYLFSLYPGAGLGGRGITHSFPSLERVLQRLFSYLLELIWSILFSTLSLKDLFGHKRPILYYSSCIKAPIYKGSFHAQNQRDLLLRRI